MFGSKKIISSFVKELDLALAPAPAPALIRTITIEGDEARNVFGLIDAGRIARQNYAGDVAAYDLWAYIATLHPETTIGRWELDTSRSLVVVLKQVE